MSKLDLSQGFHQIRMNPMSADLTTFVCPRGKFKFTKMPFGLKNAPAVFQAAIEQVLNPINDVASNYIDDILVYSGNWKDHLVDLEKVLKLLFEAGLTVKRTKCEFGRKYLLYLGHQVGCGKIAVPEHRVVAMKEYGRPKTKKTT